MTLIAPEDVDLVALADLLRRRGHVRGNPVALSLFHDEIPEPYVGREVEPCAIVRQAMDFGEHAYVDANHHSCLAGAWQAGFIDPPEEIRTGAYLAKYTPYFTEIAAARVKSGQNVLPPGTARAIGAAPLDQVPAGVKIDSLVVVCEPQYAATIAGARASIDGTPPRGAAGTSLCGELFAVPWHEGNVILTPGDMGGRMFNHVKPSEMFVIVPFAYLGQLPTLLGERPDLGALLEAIKPGYLAARDAKRHARSQPSPNPSPKGVWGRSDALEASTVTKVDEDSDALEASTVTKVDEDSDALEASTVTKVDEVQGEASPDDETSPHFEPTMPWDEEPLGLLAKAPDDIRVFAVAALEEYAIDHGHERITMDVMAAQMESVGMRLDDVLEMLDEQ